jgi:putative membrane protein
MRGFVIGTIATAAAFLILAQVFPQVKFEGDLPALLLLSLLFGVINGFVKPVVKLLSWPVNALTLGLFGLVINAALLLLVAFIADNLFAAGLTIGGFPDQGLTTDVALDAFIASLILSAIQTVVGLVVPD